MAHAFKCKNCTQQVGCQGGDFNPDIYRTIAILDYLDEATSNQEELLDRDPTIATLGVAKRIPVETSVVESLQMLEEAVLEQTEISRSVFSAVQ